MSVNKTTTYSKVAVVKQDWLWPERIPYGQITLIAGNSDSAKSLWLADVIARVTRGAEWPDGAGRAPKGSVLSIGEDPPDSVHAPRLIAARADLRRVSGWSGSFLLDNPNDMADLRNWLKTHCSTRLIVLDPLQDYLTNAHNYHAVRSTLDELARMARKFRLAVICVGHPPKVTVEPLHAFGGSRGIPAAARQFWYIARQENDTRLLLWVKSNLSDQRTGLEFTPEKRFITTKDGTRIETVAVNWKHEPVLMTAADWYMLERAKLKAIEPKGAKVAAMVFLKELLGDGKEHSASEVTGGAAERDIKRGSLHAARMTLKLVVKKVATEDGGWVWSWPNAKPEQTTKPKPEEIKPEPRAKRQRKAKDNIVQFPAAKKPVA